MGVKDINSTLKDIIAEVIPLLQKSGHFIQEYGFRTVPLSYFKGCKIAFDASICINAKIITAHNDLLATCPSGLQLYDRSLLQQRFIKDIICFIGTFMKEGITPIFVFDGQIHPYKKQEVEERIEDKKIKSDYIEQMRNNLTNIHPLDRTQEMEEELKKSMKNFVKITREDRLLLKSVLQSLGICCIDASYDAEKLCAALCREGVVSAVFGNDTDNYPLGTPILISKMSWNGMNNVCNIVILNEVLCMLSCYFGYNVTQEILIDLCIIHGCDFNDRMVIPKKKHDPLNPYKACGAKTGLDLIKQYGKFENFPHELYHCMTPLNIGICRYMFSYESSGITDEDIINIDWNLFCTNYRNVLATYKVERYIEMYFNEIDVSTMKIKKTQQIIDISTVKNSGYTL